LALLDGCAARRHGLGLGLGIWTPARAQKQRAGSRHAFHLAACMVVPPAGTALPRPECMQPASSLCRLIKSMRHNMIASMLRPHVKKGQR
jgi:hypothetical protein